MLSLGGTDRKKSFDPSGVVEFCRFVTKWLDQFLRFRWDAGAAKRRK
jgi:hypothetical protein